MVVAKRTSKNQLTLPKAVVEQRPCDRGWQSWASTRLTSPMLFERGRLSWLRPGWQQGQSWLATNP